MGRSGYSEDCDGWELIRWRGAVASAIRGKRGQAFLHELIAALDALPEKRLIAHQLEADGQVCALGSVGKTRQLDMSTIDPCETDEVAAKFGISEALVKEIAFINDNDFGYNQSPEERFAEVRKWAVGHTRQGGVNET